MYKEPNAMWQFPAVPFFKITILASALAALGLVTGCSSSPHTAKSTTSKQLNSGYLDASSLDSLEDLLSATDMRAVEGDRLLILKHGDVWKRMTVGFKMDLNHWDPRIEAQRSWFVSRQPYLDRLSARASRYLYHTVKEAERRGIPTELALLPVIESSYDPAATSSAAAAGLWQFIPSTGRIYGLKQTSQYDGRRDVVESTRAAYEFLSSLYNQFGSWELALAAYNAGPGRIQQAINRNEAAGLPTDYWSLKLPQETMNYVPRFLAVAQIIKNPKEYGVSLPPIANRPHFREVKVNPSADLNQIAATAGLSRAELYALNPGYRGDRVDPESPMRILIPADVKPSIDAKLQAIGGGSSGFWASNNTASAQPQAVTINTVTRSSSQPSAVSRVEAKTHQIVDAIARPLKTTPRDADELAAFAANADVPSAPRIPVDVVPSHGVKAVRTEPPISKAEQQQILATAKQEGSKENVDQALEPQPSQAEKEQVIAELKSIAPKGTEIVDPYDGKIRLTAIQTSQSVADSEGKEVTKGFAYPKSVVASVGPDSYEVQNNKNKAYVKTENDVVVVPPKGKRTTYTVVAGDTLATIAAKNAVSWRDIADWNQINPKSTLYVGTSLYLYDAKPQEPVQSKPESYIVKANDSLSSVADQFGLTVKQLADYNNLPANSGLLVGQKLSLKDDGTTQKSTSRGDTKTAQVATKSYTVKRGEYLKLIADRYNLSNQELADLTTGLTSNSSLYVGQKINVPSGKAAAQDVDKAESSNRRSDSNTSDKVDYYKVERGDTLSSIADKFKMSLADLRSLNRLSSRSSIRTGQTLKLPAGSIIPDQYKVQSGDSLNSVANKFNLDLADLAKWNGLSRTAGLRVGQQLQLNDSQVKVEEPKVESPKKTSKSKASSKTESYSVKSGESLNSIASRLDISVKELADLNDLSARSSLQIGQELQIPKKITEYKIKRGDTLIGLAKKYGITTTELSEMNGFKKNPSLRLGEIIKVPNL